VIDLIDIVIVAAVLIGLANGYRRGFWLSAAQYSGLVVGVLLGATAATPVLNYLEIHNTVARPLGAVLVLVIGGSLGSSIGFAAGEPIRRKILRTGVHTSTDSIGGAVLSTVAVLTMCWFLGLSFSRGPSQEVAQQIQRSVVLHTLDNLAPRPPAFLASIQGILSGVSFPPVFAGLEPAIGAPLPLPASVDTAGVNRAAQSVVKISSLGCGGLVTGSGFPVGTGYIVTNAHVVSGTSTHTILTPAGTQLPGSVVYFDPERDVAVLYVADYRSAPLVFGPAQRGTKGAVIGYPGGGPEQTRHLQRQFGDATDLRHPGQGATWQLRRAARRPRRARARAGVRDVSRRSQPGLRTHRRRDPGRRQRRSDSPFADEHRQILLRGVITLRV
jgi:hypothetical protein